MRILRIIGLVNGEPSEFDGKYVREYDPTVHRADGSYDGGRLVVTDDPQLALKFASPVEALECWRKPYGIRPDGQPNRPLTAFSVVVDVVRVSGG